MKNFRLSWIIFIFCVPMVGWAEDARVCEIESAAQPLYPLSTTTAHILAQNDCSVEVTFDLNSEGVPKVTSATTEDRCILFQKSAVDSIRASKFKVGAEHKACKSLVTFTIEDET